MVQAAERRYGSPVEEGNITIRGNGSNLRRGRTVRIPSAPVGDSIHSSSSSEDFFLFHVQPHKHKKVHWTSSCKCSSTIPLPGLHMINLHLPEIPISSVSQNCTSSMRQSIDLRLRLPRMSLTTGTSENTHTHWTPRVCRC